MEKLTIFPTVLRGFSGWISFRRLRLWTLGSNTKRDALASASSDFVEMAEPTSRPFTSRDERRAFRARQALWIQYEDNFGNVRESIVEMYHPGDRDVIFTWCRLVLEPRAFARRRIQSWRLLNERYTFDPVAAQYWDEEGALDGSKRVPWSWWLREQLEKETYHEQKMSKRQMAA